MSLTNEEQLMEALGEYSYDPVAFVYWAFPWGEPGELAKFDGPDEWQLFVLESLRDGLITVDQAIQIAIASGHGIGKSALVAMIVWWAFSTFPDTRGVVTANTENQLKTKTWVEIAKWHRLFIAKDLFKCTATALFSKDENRAKEWRIDIVPWSERNTEAFAGLHNQGKRILIIFDEASAIPEIIWETTEGAMTDSDTEIIWVCFGNPTRTNGRFRECFDDGKFARRWLHRKIDSRTVKITNKTQIQKWLEDYGEDSDFFRVRVRGEFPKQDLESFISRELVTAAIARRATGQESFPVVLGVDVARFGGDSSVIYPRQGLDAASRPVLRYSGIDTMAFAAYVVQAMAMYDAVAAMVDGTGIGGGVVDRLRQLQVNVIEVGFSEKAWNLTSVKYANRRAEIWGLMRDWLNEGGQIPEAFPGQEVSMLDQLTAPSYSFVRKDMIQLESKEMMKLRGVPSPDEADALACTFAMPDLADHQRVSTTPAATPDYNPFAEARIHESA